MAEFDQAQLLGYVNEALTALQAQPAICQPLGKCRRTCEGSVRIENKIQSGEPSCGRLTVMEPIFKRSDP